VKLYLLVTRFLPLRYLYSRFVSTVSIGAMSSSVHQAITCRPRKFGDLFASRRPQILLYFSRFVPYTDEGPAVVPDGLCQMNGLVLWERWCHVGLSYLPPSRLLPSVMVVYWVGRGRGFKASCQPPQPEFAICFLGQGVLRACYSPFEPPVFLILPLGACSPLSRSMAALCVEDSGRFMRSVLLPSYFVF